MALTAVASGVVPARTRDGRSAVWAATGRAGGVSTGPFASANLAGHVGDDPDAVAANRALLAALVDTTDLAVMDAVHGNAVAFVDEPGEVAGVDALVTDRPGLAIAALAADCATVALFGHDDRTVAVVHCGWQGLVHDVVGETVAALRARRVAVAAAVVGPAVCGTCYPVPDERAEEVRRSRTAAVAAAALVRCADGQPGIDVAAGVVQRVQELSPTAVVARSPRCTREDPDLFSYRRDGVTGRQGLVVARAGGGA